jgi:hypothetical protein
MLSPWFFNLVRKVVRPGREQTVPAWLIGQRDVELENTVNDYDTFV